MPTSKKEKTPKKKGEQSYWIKSEEDNEVFIPRVCLDQQIDSIPRVLARHGQSTLIATTCSVETASAPNYIQTNQQYVFSHPDTIQLCGFSIIQLLSIHNPSSHPQSIVCKLLPSNQLEPSKVAVSNTVIRNCQVNYGDLVNVTSFNTSPPVAGVLQLEPCDTINFPISPEFKSYLVSQLDGSVVSNGYDLQVEYMGHVSWFKVTSLVPAGGCHGSLVAEMSNLSLYSEMEEETAADDVQIVDSRFCIVTLHSQVVIQRQRPCSAVSLDSLRGMDKQVKILNEIVLLPLSAPDAFKKKNIRLPRGVLLHGPTGVGKSLLAEAVANTSRAQVISITSQQPLLCMDAVHNGVASTIILIDPLDTVCPRLDQTSSDSDRQAVTSLTNLFDQINKVDCVVVIATTSRLDVVEPALRRPGRFDKEVEVTVPNPLERKQILEFCFKDISHSLSEADIRSVADAAHGHVRADLVQVCSEAQCKALSRTLQNKEWKECLLDEFCVNSNDVWAALRETRPSAMREVTIEVPKVLWSDIGGQENIKQKFKESVEWPLKHPEAFIELGIEPPKGVLLYGPPGCSKTMIARALATESGLNFISVKGPELFSKYVGDSERAVRQVFNRARATAPSIVFFDEIDALAVQRKSDGANVADRVLAQLLTEMGGVEHLTDVLVVAATNRPDIIDEALLRPGRIDRVLYVPLPDDDTRRKIFELRIKKTPVGDDVMLDDLVTKTNGYSGAEIVALCQEAGMNVLRENISSRSVCHRHFIQALTVVKPKTKKELLTLYERYGNA